MKIFPIIAAAFAAITALTSDAIPLHIRRLSSPAYALSEHLTNRVTIEGLLRHAKKFQRFADDHEGNRGFGSVEHNGTLNYIVDFSRRNGYVLTYQPNYPIAYPYLFFLLGKGSAHLF